MFSLPFISSIVGFRGGNGIGYLLAIQAKYSPSAMCYVA